MTGTVKRAIAIQAPHGEGGERLQKLLAAAGHGSRREVEEWIRAGRLTVNGRPATLGLRAMPDADVRLDGGSLTLLPQSGTPREVLLYHKPMSEVTTRRDPQRRPTVFERLPAPQSGRWIVIGRLDVNTTGLLLFTNDGELAHRLMHPSSEIEREYLVRVRGAPLPATIEALRRGVLLEDGPARFDRIESVPAPLSAKRAARRVRAAPGEHTGPGETAGLRSHSWYRVTLHEGRNREVRRLWTAVGFEVSRLARLRFGGIELPGDLPPGACRHLSPGQVALLVNGLIPVGDRPRAKRNPL